MSRGPAKLDRGQDAGETPERALARERAQRLLVEHRLNALVRQWELRLETPGLQLALAWLVWWERVFPSGSRRRDWASRLYHIVKRGRRTESALDWRLAEGEVAVGPGPPPEAPAAHRQVLDPAYRLFVERAETPLEVKAREGPWPYADSLPTVSVTTVMGAMPAAALEQTATSLRRQTYVRWTWHVVDAENAAPITLAELARQDPRLRIVPGGEVGAIAANLNLALQDATGDLTVVLDPGATLAAWALQELAEAARQHPDVAWFYGDFDHLDELGYRTFPVFLADWSPEAMLSMNMLEPAAAFRRALTDRLGAPDASRQSAALWDFGLRALRAGERFHHIASILAHRPAAANPIELEERIPASWRASRASTLTGHLSAVGLPRPETRVEFGKPAQCSWSVDPRRRVSIVIPSRDHAVLLEACLRGLYHATAHPSIDVVVVDSGSRQAETLDLYARYAAEPRFTTLPFHGPFNFGAACNLGARQTSGELILFLNNDTEVLEPGWLEAMAKWFSIDGVGAVGAKLLYPDGRIQHAGVVVGMGGLASHLFQGQREGTESIFGTPEQVRNVSAVTAACMLVSRKAFEAVGGFDESFVLNYSDVDLCLRLRHAGRRIVYEPQARLIHRESHTHLRRIPRRDFELASERWTASGDLDGDPYFNPNLSYMSALPIFNRGPHDHPRALNRRLMRRMPRKEILTLPDDLR
jgi:GT2 family glycosyltransferase